MHPAIKAGNVAVITGAAYGGIGYAFALKLAQLKLKVALADNSAVHLQTAQRKLQESGIAPESVLCVEMDVTKPEDNAKLANQVFDKWGQVDVLHLNAGRTARAKALCWTNPDIWEETLNTNFLGVVNGVQAFVGRMLQERTTPGLVIATGSKQGITLPPGTGGPYNVSKAAVKAFAECLSHELREANPLMSTALLVPGWVFSKLTSGGASAQEGAQKPEGAWTPEQTVNFLLDELDKGHFYIICPDNETSQDLDRARMQWSADDLLKQRPALSRWHPDYAEAFSAHVKSVT